MIPPPRPGKLQPKFGLPPDGKARWCGPCHKEHAPTAVNVAHKKCEDCNEKMAGFTLPGSKTPRWCAQCSDKHPGAEMRGRPKCEVCHDKPGTDRGSKRGGRGEGGSGGPSGRTASPATNTVCTQTNGLPRPLNPL
jgi:hypothetical protein